MSQLGDHKGTESFNIADKKFTKRSNMSGGANVFQRIANDGDGGGVDPNDYVDWDSFARAVFASTLDIRATEGFFATRYTKHQGGGYSDGGTYKSVSNGAHGSWFVHTKTGSSVYNRSGYVINNLVPISNTNQYLGACDNFGTSNMTVDITVRFGTDTDDNTRFGMEYAFATTDLLHEEFDFKTADWITLVDYSTFRGNGWGSPARNQTTSTMSDNHSPAIPTNHQVEVPPRTSLYVRVYGELYSGSDQYETVGLMDFNISNPRWQ